MHTVIQYNTWTSVVEFRVSSITLILDSLVTFTDRQTLTLTFDFLISDYVTSVSYLLST